MSSPIIEVKNLSKTFGQVVAVNNISFTVDEKDFLILLGPSGCGKTTILRMIAGLEIPTEGEIYLRGRPVFSNKKGIFLPARERGVGLVFQSYALWPHMTVFENIAFGLKVKKEKADAIHHKVDKVLGYMQLDNMSDRYPQEMSGGQQQRVALARMLVSEPDILLMDEPLSNLDAKLRLEMRTEIKNIHYQRGATTVYVTHDQVEGQTMAHNIAVINKGIIEQLASPKTIYNRPANLFVADFIGSPPINLIEGKTVKKHESDTVMVKNDLLELTTDYKNIEPDINVMAAVRPENIAIHPENGLNTIRCKISAIMPSGPETVLRVICDRTLFNILITQEIDVVLGQQMNLYLPPNQILLFDKASGRLLPK